MMIESIADEEERKAQYSEYDAGKGDWKEFAETTSMYGVGCGLVFCVGGGG